MFLPVQALGSDELQGILDSPSANTLLSLDVDEDGAVFDKAKFSELKSRIQANRRKWMSTE